MSERQSDASAPSHVASAPVAPAVTRVRHAAKIRELMVLRVERPVPWMIRITVGGEDLVGFVSLGFDDHIKLFIPSPGKERPNLPVLGPHGVIYPENVERPVMRDFTPRRFDADRRELTIELAVHGAGPAADWAAAVSPGDFVRVGGPRGSMIVPADFFERHILIGDETALPAISRRLEEMPAGTQVLVFAEVEDAGGEIELQCKADLQISWAYRKNSAHTSPLFESVRSAHLVGANTYVWVACESSVAKMLRKHFVGDRGFDPIWVKAAGYWRRGSVAIHEVHDE